MSGVLDELEVLERRLAAVGVVWEPRLETWWDQLAGRSITERSALALAERHERRERARADRATGQTG